MLAAEDPSFETKESFDEESRALGVVFTRAGYAIGQTVKVDPHLPKINPETGEADYRPRGELASGKITSYRFTDAWGREEPAAVVLLPSLTTVVPLRDLNTWNMPLPEGSKAELKTTDFIPGVDPNFELQHHPNLGDLAHYQPESANDLNPN